MENNQEEMTEVATSSIVTIVRYVLQMQRKLEISCEELKVKPRETTCEFAQCQKTVKEITQLIL